MISHNKCMRKKQVMAASLATMLMVCLICPAVVSHAAQFKAASFTTAGLYDNVTEQAMELIKGVDPTDKTALITAGYSDKTVNSVSDIEIGDIYITTQEDGTTESYIYLSTITAIHLTGVDTYEQVSFQFYPGAEYMSYQKEDEEYTVPTGLTCKYGEKVTSVALPSGFVWESDDTVESLTSDTYRIRYVPSNPLRYKTVKHIDVVVTGVVNKVEQLTVPVVAPIIYDEKKTLADVILPSGWVWDTPATVPDSSVSVYPATYAPTPADCYDLSALSTTKANIALTVLHPGAVTDYKVTIGKGWQLYDIPKPISESGTYSYKNSNTTYTQAGEYKATLLFTPADGSLPSTVLMSIVVDEDMPEFVEPTGLTSKYGELLSTVQLPSGWAWVNPDLTVGNAGKSQASAIFTDGVNVTRKNLTITVSKATFKPTKPDNLEVEWHKGLKLTDIALPSGWVWDKSELKMGENEYAITYAPSGGQLNNYDYKDSDIHTKITVKVKKTTPVYHVPKAISVAKGTTLEDSLLPDSDNGKFHWQESETVTQTGTYLCEFVPKDTEHYRTIKDIEVTVKVFGDSGDNNKDNEQPQTNESPQVTQEQTTETVTEQTETVIQSDTKKPVPADVKSVVVKEEKTTLKLPVNVKVQAPLKNIFARDIKVGDTELPTTDTTDVKQEVKPLVVNPPNEGPATTEQTVNEKRPDITPVSQEYSKTETKKTSEKHGIAKMVFVGIGLILCGLVCAGIFLKRKMVKIPVVQKKMKG